MKLSILLSTILFLGFTGINAQPGTIKGFVNENLTNHPVPYVNVVVLNTTIGTTTDSIGYFEIKGITSDFVQLQISSIGYEPYLSEVISVSKVNPTTVALKMQSTSQSLQEVQVSAKYFVSRPESPVSLQSIGIDMIEKSAGANRDIAKVLQSFPGVGSATSFRNDLIVRGGGPSENRYYLDGIEIPTLNHFSSQGASGGSISILNVDFIREVDFYSGAFPSARGNAMSSVFEFKQIDGNKDKPAFKGSLGASELSLSINTPLSEKTTLIAGGRRSYLQFLFDQLGLPFLPTYNDFSFKTKTRFDQHNELTILGVGSIDQFKLNPSPTPSEENDYILSYIPTNTQWNYTIGAVYKHFFDNSYITLAASRSHLNNKSYKYLNNIETPDNLNYDYKSNEIENKLRLEFTARPNNFSINAGVSLEHGFYDNNTYQKIYTNSTQQILQYQTDLSLIKWGVFGSVAHPFLQNRLSVSLGARMDANNYSSQMNNLLNQFSPRLGASYSLTDKLFLNGSIARYYQMPAYTTLGYKQGDEYINRTNQLKYIHADHYILGFEYRPNNFTKISVEGFVKNYSNYPFSVLDSVSLASKGGDYGVFGDEEVTPTSSGKTKGFEVMIQRRSPKQLNYIFAYTFVRSEFTDAQNQYVPSSWDCKHLFTATISKNLKKNWVVGMKWRYSGGLPYTPYDFEKSSYVLAWDAHGREYLDYSKFNTQRLAAFHQLDLRVDKTYTFKNWSLGLYMDIQNAYNKKSQNPDNLVQVKDANGQPIVLNAGDPIEQQKYQLKPLQSQSGTILPTIGVIVEF